MANLNIYSSLLTRPPQDAYSPDELVALEGKKASLKSIGQQQQLNDQSIQLNDQTLRSNSLKAEEYEAAKQRALQVQQALQKHNGDIEKALPEINAIDASAGAKLSDHLVKKQKEARELEEQTYNTQVKRRDLLADAASVLLSIKDPGKRAAAQKVQNASLVATGLFKAEDLPQTNLSDEDLSGFLTSVQLGKQEQAAIAAANQKRLDAEETRKQAEHEATLPGKRVDPATGMTKSDSTKFEETKRHNKATEATAAERAKKDDGLTAAQLAAQARAEAKDEKAVRMTFQREIIDGQNKIDALQVSKKTAEGEVAKWNAVLTGNPSGKKREEAVAKLAEAKGELASIETQQKEHKARMDAAQLAKDTAPGGRLSGGTPAATARPRATDGKGNFVEWDGSAWVKVAK